MKILAIDTSAKAASTALLEDEKLLGEFYTHSGLTHSQTLMPMVEQLLSCCQVTLPQIDVMALSAGPGSFTGLRIGMAAIKGMAFPQNTPCVKVSTLEGLCYNLPEFSGLLCPVMDARCGQVYNALFQWNEGSLNRLTPDRAITIPELEEELKACTQPILLLGDGSPLCYQSMQLHQLSLAGAANRYQRASGVGLCAYRAAQRGETLPPDQLRPDYLRLPQAQRELMMKKNLEFNGGNPL